MRDVLLSIVVFGSLPFILWRPRIGALMWAWVSMMVPNHLTYGFAQIIPFAQIIAITTLVALVFSSQRQPLPWHPIIVLIVLIVGWMSITSLNAKGDPTEVFEFWYQVVKIHLMLFVTLMLIRGQKYVDQLIWVIVLSIGLFGLKGGVWVILTGGGERVYGPQGGILSNNNEFALGLVMLIPLMYYLMGMSAKKWIKVSLIFSMVMCGFAILGSHSRGAFVALGAMALVLALKSGRPITMTVCLALAGLSMIPLMPEHWTERMESIQTYDDASAQGRLETWGLIWNMVQDYPILGAGFAFASPEFVTRYSTVEMKAWTAHSVYFQALGEHGFVGLALYLALFGYGWTRAGKLARLSKSIPELLWVSRLMPMVQVALSGYAVGGAFLSMLYFDYAYYLLGFVVLADCALAERLRTERDKKNAELLPRVAVGRNG